MHVAPLAFAMLALLHRRPSPSLPTQSANRPAGFLGITAEALKHRESRRLTEAELLRMSKEPNTVVLDARSAERFRQMHIKGCE